MIAGQRRAPSLGTRLLGLVGILALALVSLGGIALWQAHDNGRERMGETLLGLARAMALLVDEEFGRNEALLLGIAGNGALAMGDAEAFLTIARRLDRAVDGLVVAYAEAPGRTLASTLEGVLPQPLPITGGLAAVFERQATTISDFYRGRVTGSPAVSMAVPVPSPDGGAPRYAVGIVLNHGRLREVMTRQRMPTGAVAAILDRTGTVVARTRNEEAVAGRPATEPVLRALAERDSGVIERIVNQDGELSLLAYARAPRTGYAVVIAAPETALTRERNAALIRLALFAVPVVAGALLVALLLGLRLRTALARLPAGLVGPRLREVEDLATALSAADHARAAAEAELRERTAWLEQTQRAAAVGVWTYDLVRDELRWSETMWRLYGLDPARDGPASAALFRAHVLPEDNALVNAAQAEARRSGVYEAEFRIRRGDGAIRWMRAQGVMERGPDGTPIRLLGANLDITERRELEEERERLLAQKDLLVAEIHHRVKNSLQLVQGLLLLQARGAEEGLAARLREAAGRIVSIAAVHRRLYEGGTEQQDAADHLTGLTQDLERSLGSAARHVALDAVEGVRLPPERMAALGLLVTELVTNAFKHGAGTVTVRLGRDGAEAVVAIEDEGPGFPEGFEPSRSRGLGMRVAVAMARQLRGRLDIGPCARVSARFPIG